MAYLRSTRLLAFLLAATFCPAIRAASSDGLDAVRNDIVQGQADDAVRRLKQALTSNDQNAEAHNLLCRVSLQLEQWDQAVAQCERATTLSPDSSNYHLWLGRAYGAKAERASMFSAYGFARKLRDEFERAVTLDGRNADAMADLGEFYCSAPSMVGGSTSKAESLVQKLNLVDPIRAHELRARIADSKKDYVQEEAEFKAAISASPHPANEWMSLASFYRKRGRLDDMVRAVKSGIAADKLHSVALVNGASTLIKSQQELPLAAQMLKDYLGSNQKSEDSPAFEVHVQLGKLLAKQGDSSGAQHEFQAALALAHDYKPASQAAGTGH
ncbi:MAG TPA: tetratricopeptide repeat protein [Acidisarcina sp.]|nr:tetratricopeptide repeat protein [Acidisarcina sp.]